MDFQTPPPPLSPTLSELKKPSSPPLNIRRMLQNVTLLQIDLALNDKQMFHVKYKLFCYIIYSSVSNCRGLSNCIFSKFLPPIAFNYNNNKPTQRLSTQLTVSKVLYITSKTLETVNVLQESHSFKPCTKAEIDFVEIKCPVFNTL